MFDTTNRGRPVLNMNQLNWSKSQINVPVTNYSHIPDISAQSIVSVMMQGFCKLKISNSGAVKPLFSGHFGKIAP